MSGAGQDQAREAVEIAREQRRRIALGVHIPRWYRALSALALAAIFLAPALVSDGNRLVLVTSASIAVLGLVDVVVTRASGIRVRLHDARRHPSLRRPLAGLLGSIALGSAATWLALEQLSPAASAACGLIAAAAILTCRARMLDAVRRDIATGS